MTHPRTPHRPARRLLLAAAMLPLTPLAAQDAAPSVEAPPVTITPPDAPTPAPSAAPVQPVLRNGIPVGGTPTAEPAPAEEASIADEPAARPTRTERRATQRAAERPRVSARAAAPAPDPAPEPAFEPAPAVTEAPPVEAPLAPVAALPAAAVPEASPVESAPGAEDRIGLAETWPLLAAGLLAIGGLAMLLLARRRRRREEAVMEQAYHDEAPVYHEAPVAVEPAMAVAPAMAAPLVHANDEHHEMASAPATAVAANGRPWLELMMHPVRAGVGDEDARVEFELTVANQGSAPARDVRVSTFMLAGGSSDMEQSLIDRPSEPQLAEPELDPGDGRRIESAVAMPRAGLHDSILPVVVADARYRLPDGSEGRTSARFAVGVPVDGDLAHFDVEHPSGLHEGVEARLEREPEQV
jgi:hypothetical protein